MAKIVLAFLGNVVALQPFVSNEEKALDRKNAVEVLTNLTPSNPLNQLDDNLKHEIFSHFPPVKVPRIRVDPFCSQFSGYGRNDRRALGDVYSGTHFDWINRVDPSFKKHSLCFDPDNDLYIVEYNIDYVLTPGLETEIIHFDEWLQRPEVNFYLNSQYKQETNSFYGIHQRQESILHMIDDDDMIPGRVGLDNLLMDPPDDNSPYFQARKPNGRPHRVPHPQRERDDLIFYHLFRRCLIQTFYHVWSDPTVNYLKPRLNFWRGKLADALDRQNAVEVLTNKPPFNQLDDDLKQKILDQFMDEKEEDLCRKNIIVLKRVIKQQEMYAGKFPYN